MQFLAAGKALLPYTKVVAGVLTNGVLARGEHVVRQRGSRLSAAHHASIEHQHGDNVVELSQRTHHLHQAPVLFVLQQRGECAAFELGLAPARVGTGGPNEPDWLIEPDGDEHMEPVAPSIEAARTILDRMQTTFRAFVAIDTDPDDVYSDSDSGDEIDADAPMP